MSKILINSEERQFQCIDVLELEVLGDNGKSYFLSPTMTGKEKILYSWLAKGIKTSKFKKLHFFLVYDKQAIIRIFNKEPNPVPEFCLEGKSHKNNKDKPSKHISSIFLYKEMRYKNISYGDLDIGGCGDTTKLIIMEYPKDLKIGDLVKMVVIEGEEAKNKIGTILTIYENGGFDKDIANLSILEVS